MLSIQEKHLTMEMYGFDFLLFSTLLSVAYLFTGIQIVFYVILESRNHEK